MADVPDTLSAEQLDKMTPDERATAFEERIVTNPEAIPADFRERIFERARRLGQRSSKKTG